MKDVWELFIVIVFFISVVGSLILGFTIIWMDDIPVVIHKLTMTFLATSLLSIFAIKVTD